MYMSAYIYICMHVSYVYIYNKLVYIYNKHYIHISYMKRHAYKVRGSRDELSQPKDSWCKYNIKKTYWASILYTK